MSGFLLHERRVDEGGLWPVSLGNKRPCRQFLGPAFRLAVIETADPGAAGWFMLNDGQVWLEGACRPRPDTTDSLSTWLGRCDGSFRGVFFPSSSSDVLLIADPYGSRPVYYSDHPDAPAASDKLCSLPPLAERFRSLRWDVIVEALSTGCVLSAETSLQGVFQVEGGCTIRLSPGRRPALQRYAAAVAEPDACRSRRTLLEDALQLGQAVREAARESWVSEDAYLLLSGGFDSRWILQSAPPGRRTLTVGPAECRETLAAARVAELCRATNLFKKTREDRWVEMVARSHLLTGGLYEPLKLLFAEEAEDWASEGIRKVAHGYLFDTLLKGYFVYRSDAFNTFDSRLFPLPAAVLSASILGERYLRELAGALSAEGREMLETGMRRRNETTPWESHGGFEYGHERRVLSAISRQVDAPMTLSLMEHVGVEAPIFHRSLWKWWRESCPEHRKPSLAYLLAFLLHGGRPARLPRGDTGDTALRTLLRVWVAKRFPDHVRRRIREWSARRQAVAMAGHPAQAETVRSAWGVDSIEAAMQSKRGMAVLAEGLSELQDAPILGKNVESGLMQSLESRLSFDIRLVCFLASVGAWKKAVREASRPAIRSMACGQDVMTIQVPPPCRDGAVSDCEPSAACK